MAEAVVNHFLAGKWQAFSAGTKPVGYVHPLAVQALSEIGIDFKGQSKSVEQFYGQDFEAVITVCDGAAENCPVWLGQGRRIHLGFPDPARVEGTEDDQLQAFRQVRDAIQLRLLDTLNTLIGGSPNQ
jgi:arsenate reductase